MTGLFEWLLQPALWLGLCLALLYAALFHAWQGRTLAGLGWFALASLAGFAAGQLAGAALHFPALGQVQIVAGTLGAASALTLVRARLHKA
ncbi:MAG: hypothetical protein IPO15_23620 [Anaerolineae bacterium]|uniref:hypothetical protein n=1 Tax=Candidatus Amarolinea dominans TaxID=3140696 RepID=UPI00313639C2|nr:hypothetical protein [Anaerolineae bacterium]